MNKNAILGLAVIAGIIVMLVFILMDSGTYATFEDASINSQKSHTIVGVLNKEKPVTYDPTVDANLTTLYVKDKDDVEKKVLFHQPKPRDIEKSETITMTGKMVDDIFHAEQILVKCPSKYNDGKMDVNKMQNQTFGSKSK